MLGVVCERRSDTLLSAGLRFPLGQVGSPAPPGRRSLLADAVLPLVESGLRDPQRPAGEGVVDAVFGLLGADEGRHTYRPIASRTRRTAERLSVVTLIFQLLAFLLPGRLLAGVLLGRLGFPSASNCAACTR
ncbi:hypothetical protein [Planobispora rosea]|uniref:hypothetical protein n=1 Tax=Planobispora rosea TaxID=35762 RepID=UPI00166F7C62|nr:hypothetical protein [Planobispora rosea]